VACPSIIGPDDKLGLLVEGVREEAIFKEQIVRILQEAEGGMSTKDVCRKHNVSEQSFYRWKAKYGGMGVSEVKRLRELEQENAKLKKLLAEAELDKAALKDLLNRKW
jgi:putative transposase